MKRAMICFTRVPRPGRTKTRLLPVFTPEQCAGIHTAFLRDLAGVYGAVDADLFIAYTPDPDWQQLRPLFPGARDFFPQEGADLGEKMLHAITRVLEQGYESCILTGSDLPELTAAHLEAGFDALEGADAVLSPTSDGGYYLVGMHRPREALFRVAGYGTATVWENTLSSARAAGLTVAAGLPCDDVDTPEDLRRLAGTLPPESHTARFLNELRKAGNTL